MLKVGGVKTVCLQNNQIAFPILPGATHLMIDDAKRHHLETIILNMHDKHELQPSSFRWSTNVSTLLIVPPPSVQRHRH